MVEEFLLERIMTRIDQLDQKIDDLCDRMTKTEISISNHLTHVTQDSEKKERKFYVIIAALGTIFASVTLVQTLI
tara:strand:+ start:262 stop:486 length:225 start_codon:yes stop_codon:yes gene_type:complete